MRQMTGKAALVLAIGFGLTASLLVWVYLRNISEAEKSSPKVAVVIATSDIQPRTTLTKEMLKIQEVPEDVRHPKSYTSIDQLEGKVTRLAITEGEQVLDSRIFAEREESGLAFVIPAGKRAVSVGVSEVIGSGGLIVPGDKVDVVAVFDSRMTGKDMATMVLQDVEVLAVGQLIFGQEPVSLASTLSSQQSSIFGGSKNNKEETKTDPQAQPAAKSVTLAVSADEAQRLILAEEKGKIRLALRPYGEGNKVDVPEAVLASIRGLGR